MTSAAPIPADVVKKVSALGPPGTPMTTPEVAEGFDCSQRTIYNRLESLVDDGILQTKKVGANSRVWWRPVEPKTRQGGTTWHRDRVRSHPVFDSEMVGVIVWGHDFTSTDTTDLVIKDANDAFLEIAGFEYEEALETSWRDLTPEDFYEVSEQHIEEVNATGSGVAYDKQYYHADGSRWWGLFESQKLDDSTYVEFVVDITDRKQAKERLHESEQRLRKAISIDTVGVLFFDLSGNISDANAAFERMSGYSREELHEIDWEALTPPEFMDATDRKAAELATRGETAPYEKQLIHKDGSRWWGLFAPERLSGTGDTAECVEFIIDITDRKQAEEQLRESEERYRMLFESIIEGFCTIEMLFDEDDEPMDYRFLETNPAFEDQTGLVDATGKRMKELEPNHEDHWFEMYGRVAKTGEPVRFTERAKHLDDRWYDVHAFRVGDPEERTVAIAFDDISDAKRFQLALERLNEASRDLIDSGPEEVKEQTVDIVQSVLGVEYAALWRYDETSGALDEYASRTAPETDPGAVRLPVNRSEEIWQTFIGDDVDVDNDIDGSESESGESEMIPLRSRILIPLGRHGVICASSTRTGAFDEQMIDLVETVAATIETAWDRAEGEEELARQNDELTRLDRLNTLIRGIDQALVAADTREDIDDAVCERLADSALYEFAWIGVYDAATGTVAPRAWAGVDSAYLDGLRTEKRDTVVNGSPFTAAIRTGELQVVADVATDARAAPWREETLERGGRSCLCIPLAYDESVYGVLTVYVDMPHQEARDTDVLTELGRTIAHAIHAIETRDSVRTDTVYELTLESTAAETPLCRLSRTTDCVIKFEGQITGSDGHTTAFFTVSGVDPDEFGAACERSVAVEDLVRLDDRDDGVFYKARLADPTFAGMLLDEGATVRSLTIDAGTVTAVVDLPDTAEVSAVLTAIRRSVPDVELLARQTRTRSPDTELTLQTTFEERLTPRQQEVLQLAYRSGFFESPRLQTGKELSEALELSQSTFNYHLRGAERTLFELVFDSS